MKSTWLAILAFSLCALACTSAAAAKSRAPRLSGVDGYVFVASDAPVVHARLRVTTLAGGKLPGAGITGPNGTFSLRAPSLPTRFVLVAEGGTVNGLALPAPLRALVVNYRARRWVHVGPATTLALALVRRHPARGLDVATRTVKSYLGLPARARLGQSLRWDHSRFDGLAFMTEAAHHGGLTAYVNGIAARLDRAPGARHVYLRRASTFATLDAPSGNGLPTVGGGIVSVLLGGVVAPAAKAVLAEVLTKLGLSSVVNLFGLGSQTTQLSSIVSQLNSIQQGINQIAAGVTQIEQGQIVIEGQNAGIAYNSILTALDDEVEIATGNDAELSSIEHASSLADDVAVETAVLPASGQAQPIAWCKANPGLLSHYVLVGGTLAGPQLELQPTAAGSACSVIEQDLGSGANATGDPIAWCTAQGAALQDAAPLANYTCLALTGSANFSRATGQAYPYASVGADVTGVGGVVQGIGIVDAADRLLMTQLTSGAGTGPVVLTAANYSAPQDGVASRWTVVTSMLGLYASIYDNAENTTPQNCQPTPASSVQPNVAPADCDMRVSASLAQTLLPPAAVPAAAPAPTVPPVGQTRPDIPPGTFITFSPTLLAAGGSGAPAEWYLPTGNTATCPGTASRLWNVSFTGAVASYAQAGGTSSAACNNPAYLFSYDNPGSQDADGWSVPSASALEALFAGSASPTALLTGNGQTVGLENAGLTDLSANATLATPLPAPFATTYVAANLLNGTLAPTIANSGTNFGVWSSTCGAYNWRTGYLQYYDHSQDDRAFDVTINGFDCTYIDLSSGEARSYCVVATGAAPCNAPTTPTQYDTSYAGNVYSDGPVDFAHPATLVLTRAPYPEEYWHLAGD